MALPEKALKGPIQLVKTESMTNAEWLQHRRKGIGGSDVAAILGFNPWRSGLSVYYSKVDGQEQEENLSMKVGKALEPLLREELVKWYAEKKGETVTVEEVPFILQHPENPILLANLDGLIHRAGEIRGAELKTSASLAGRDEWGEDTVPDMHYFQIQHYIGVTGIEAFDLAALLFNRQFVRHEIPANKEVIEILQKKVTDFWNTYIVPRVPPAPEGLDDDTEILKKLYPSEQGEPIKFPPHFQELYDNYKQLREEEKIISKAIAKSKQELMAEMRDAPVGIFPNGKKATWKTVERKEHTVNASSSRVFKVY